MSAHHGNNYLPLLEKFYKSHRSALFTLLNLLGLPKPLRDWCYRCVALNRYALFGRSDACMMPTPSLVRRFL